MAHLAQLGLDLPELVGHEYQILPDLCTAGGTRQGEGPAVPGRWRGGDGLAKKHLCGLAFEPRALVEEPLLVAPHQLLALPLPRNVLPELGQDLSHPLLLGRALRELLIVPG